jgi:DOPA 4,5-dioxygenase
MKDIKRQINSHKTYHAHIYFNQDTLAFASTLCQEAGKRFGLKVGRVHQKTIGPHLEWSCQITFGRKHFKALIPWLEANRKGLSILVHALSGNDLEDHTTFAYWLGDRIDLDLSMFSA